MVRVLIFEWVEDTVTGLWSKVAVDISSASLLEIRLKPPGIATIVKASGTSPPEVELTTDGTDGLMEHKVVNPSLWTVDGWWQVQGRAELATAVDDYKSEIAKFTVFSNL